MKESLKIITRDGVSLAATRYLAEKPTQRVVIINSAAGVRQQAYADFALFLAGFGYNVYTYDYRGIGESRSGPLRRSGITFQDWGSKDFDTVVRNIFQTYPNAHLTVIAHGEGGQVIGFSEATRDVGQIVMVGAYLPYWLHAPGRWLRLRLWTRIHIAVPLLCRIFGYFPAKTIGLSEDLPSGVAQQWARWADSDDYAFTEISDLRARWRSFRHPALMISFSDDKIAPVSAVKDLMTRYEGMKWNHWFFDAGDLDQRHVGHFGFFKHQMKNRAWPALAEWLSNPSQMKESQAA